MTLNAIQHDRAVRHYAIKMLAEGYEVKARVDGWFQEPETIRGYRPDIVALKDNTVLIVEIKKGDVDWPKIQALTAFTSASPNFQLRLIVPEELPETLLS